MRRRTIITKRSWAADAAAAKEATTTFLVINSQFSTAGKQLKVLLSFPSEQRDVPDGYFALFWHQRKMEFGN